MNKSVIENIMDKINILDVSCELLKPKKKNIRLIQKLYFEIYMLNFDINSKYIKSELKNVVNKHFKKFNLIKESV